MKFFNLLLICCLAASTAMAYKPDDATLADLPDNKLCSDPWEVIHSGDDKLAGEYLRNIIDQANSLNQGEIDSQCLEVLLVCGKKAGCVFDITGQAITFLRHFKVRGELKHGKRPVVFNQGTPLVIDVNGDPLAALNFVQESEDDNIHILERLEQAPSVHFEKFNLIADPNLPGDSRITVKNGNLHLDQMLIKGHNSGITGHGGALAAEMGSTGQLRIETVTFLANGAEFGGALLLDGHTGNIEIYNSHFEDNVATEKGGAIYANDLADGVNIYGSTFKGNRATGSSMNVGEGGAIWSADSLKNDMKNSRSLGGNYAKFGQFLYILQTETVTGAIPAGWNIQGLVGIDDIEAIYIKNESGSNAYQDTLLLRINRAKLRRGVICSDNGGVVTVARGFVSFVGMEDENCGSDIQLGAYCAKSSQTGAVDDPKKEDDEDEDGVSCVYDCDDHDPDVRPGVGEVFNGTDSNCNGLIDEFIDTDGDLTPDGYDACPEDANKIAPGVCGCGLIDQADYNGCVTCATPDYGYGTAQTYKEAPNKDPVYAEGYWYILDTADWWWWDGSSWAYGGTY